MDQKQALPPLDAPLLAWYDQNKRQLPWRDTPIPYYVWVSEIMLQQTRVEAVRAYFDRFLAALPTLRDLAEADEQKLLKLWEGLGYYSRVRNLQKAAQIVQKEYGGELPPSFEELRKLPGIGDYTAGAIASIAFQLPAAAVDGNVLRVMTRVTADGRDITKAAVKKDYFARITASLPPRCGDFNQALMDLGATVCLPNGVPKCEVCPLASLCRAFQEERVMEFPVKPEKKPRKTEKKTVFLLVSGERVALRKRPDAGLLASLWEFPHEDGILKKEMAQKKLEEWGFSAISLVPSIRHKHIFSHIEWHMSSYAVQGTATSPPEGFVWVTRDELEQEFPVPSAFTPFLSHIPW